MNRLSILALAGLAPAGFALAQQAPRYYAHVDFVRPTPGKAAELRKAVEEKMPAYQKLVAEGKFAAWIHYSRAYPHGSGLDWSQVRLRIVNSFAGAYSDASSGIAPSLAISASGEIWEMIEPALNLPALLKAKYVQVQFRKMADGITPRTYEAYVNGNPRTRTDASIEKGDGPVAGVVFRVMYPSGTKSEYDYVTLTAYDDVAKIARPPLAPDAAMEAADRAIRSTVRREIWQQTSRTE